MTSTWTVRMQEKHSILPGNVLMVMSHVLRVMSHVLMLISHVYLFVHIFKWVVNLAIYLRVVVKHRKFWKIPYFMFYFIFSYKYFYLNTFFLAIYVTCILAIYIYNFTYSSILDNNHAFVQWKSGIEYYGTIWTTFTLTSSHRNCS